MSGTSITIDVDDQAVLARVSRLIGRIDDPAPAYREISEYGAESTRRRIEAGGPSPDGTPWVRHSPVTTRRKKRNKDKLLIEYGDLLGSIHPQPSATEAIWGAHKEYAAAMQFGMKKGYAGKTKRGAPIPWGDIPARPFLGLSEVDRAEVLDILSDHLSPRSQN